MLDRNLIRLFDFYLALMMVIGLWRRWPIYLDMIHLSISTLRKRKRLLGRLGEHKHILVNRDVLLPLGLVLGVSIIQWVCSRIIWPAASVTVAEAFSTWRWIPVTLLFLPMVAVDVYFLVRVSRIDRGGAESYLDTAENWLGWRSRAVRVLTFGILSPKKIVDGRVAAGLEQLGKTLSWAMWCTIIQSVLRVSFGLVIWAEWYFQTR